MKGRKPPRPPDRDPGLGASRARPERDLLEANLKSLVARGSLEAAARLLAERGRFEEAAELFGRAGLHYEAALLHLRSGDRRRALDAFTRVPSTDRHYREVCGRAVVLAADLGVLTIVLDHFLARFLKSGPMEAEEHETFFLIGQHYHRHGRSQAAGEALATLLRASPGHRDARSLLDRVVAEQRAERKQAQTIIEEEASFRAQGPGGRKRSVDDGFGSEPTD